jgi:hypothetical protein
METKQIAMILLIVAIVLSAVTIAIELRSSGSKEISQQSGATYTIKETHINGPSSGSIGFAILEEER